MIPTEAVYSDLLKPHFLKTIQEDCTDVKLHFDSGTRMLQIKGTSQSVLSTKNEVHDALSRLKRKEVKFDPALIAYLKSIGSRSISRIFFNKADVHATVDLFSNTSVVIHGLSNYDINRAEKILKKDTGLKEVQIPEEAVPVVQTKSFEDIVEELRRNFSIHVSIASVDSDDKKPICILAGQKTELCSVEKKFQEFIKEQITVTVYMVLESIELTESLPLLLNRLGLSHFSGHVKWNPDCETLELTGTNKTITDIKIAIEEKTKGLQCKTVTICRPGAFSYFKEDGQVFLNSLDMMLSCMAVLTTKPEQVNLQVF